MSYPKLTPIIAKGATEPRYLEDRFADFVNVKDYGAKGDGVTDDTEAINLCLQKNPCAQIYFPKGIFRVTDTIYAYAGAGSQTIFLSKIVYDGVLAADKPVLDISMTNADMDVDTRNYIGGAVVVGGTIDCQQKGGIGIRHDGFTGRIIGVHVLNYVSCGILLGDGLDEPRNNKSQQTLISTCELTNYPESNGVGIALVHSDCNVENCNINGCDAGFLLRTGGHHVSNCHVTNNTNPPSATNDLSGCMIRVVPFSAYQNEVSAFSNCYWNGCMKSLVNVPNTNSLLSIHMTNSDIVIGAGSEVESEAFLIDGGHKTPIHLTGCTVAHNRNLTFYGLYPWTGSEADYNVQLEDVVSNSSVKPYTLEISNQLPRYNIMASAVEKHVLDAGKARHVGWLATYTDLFQAPVTITWGQTATFAEEVVVGMQNHKKNTLWGATATQLLMDSTSTTREFPDVGVTITLRKLYFYNATESPTDNVWWIKSSEEKTMPRQLYLWHGDNTQDFIPDLSNYIVVGGYSA